MEICCRTVTRHRRRVHGCVHTCQREIWRASGDPMSRWLSNDVLSMSLNEIERAISAIEPKPSGDRTVRDVERLADLREARQGITGARRCGH